MNQNSLVRRLFRNMECQQVLLLLALVITAAVGQKNTHILPDRSTIVHLFEWKWLDIAKECEDFLQFKGFGAVQISPPNENRIVEGRPWWERYQPVSYEITTRSGNLDDFLDMTKRCNAVGVRIYADVVINHMSADGANIKGTGGNVAYPGNKTFPGVPYTYENFHNSCSINNYNDAWEVRNCELVGLKDLNQTEAYVQEKIVQYLNHLTDLGIAGFRVDASKHMNPSDLKDIYSRVKDLNTSFGFAPRSRPFIYQEVIDLGGEAVSRDEYTPVGVVTEFRYGKSLGRVFRKSDKLRYLVNWGPEWGLIPNPADALVFIDNHDNERGSGAGGAEILTYKTPKLFKMANAFMLAHPYGLPRVLSGFNFANPDEGPPHDPDFGISSPIFEGNVCLNGWTCTHRWRQIYNSVVFRNVVKGTEVTHFWFEPEHGQQISFCRGNKGFVAVSNLGDLKRRLQTCLPRGVYCDVISGDLVNGACTGKIVEVRVDGQADISIREGDEDGVVLIHVNSRLRSKL